MGLIETVGNFLPELGIFSQKTEARISALLKKSAIGINVRRYLLFSVLFSILVLIFVFLIAITITGEIIFVVGSVLVFFGIALYGCLHFPAVLAKKRAEVIESELAFVLREIALFIDLGMPFEKALEKISEGKYAVSEEFRRAMGEIRGGSSAISAISNIATRVDSRHVLRAVNLLVSAYEYGTKGENLRRLADDLVDIQKTRNREYSSRLSFVGLFFIAVSALLPAFFQVMLVVFSSLPQFDISLYQLWIGFLIVFPLINLLVLILVWKMMPPAKTGTKKFDIRGYLKRMRVEPQVAFMAAAASIVIGVLLLISGIFWAPLLYLGCLLIIFPICAYWIFEYVESRRNQEIENAIPDALFHAASLQNIAKEEKIIEAIAQGGYGELSKEFSAASNQIRAGMSVSSALSDMAERNSSKLLERVNFLMLHGYKSGGEVRRALREGAENVFLFLSLLRERASLLAVQKYTIIIGGGVLVPLILGSVLSMANSLDIGKTNFLGRESSLGGAEIKNALPLANRIYLVICCLFSSLMVGHIEGDKSKFFPYFLLMAASSLFLFSFAMDANPLKVGF